MRPGTTTTEIVYWRHAAAAGAVLTTVHEFPLLEERWRTGVSLPVRPYYRDAVTFEPMRIAEWLLLDQQPDQEVDGDDDWRALHDDSVRCSTCTALCGHHRGQTDHTPLRIPERILTHTYTRFFFARNCVN